MPTRLRASARPPQVDPAARHAGHDRSLAIATRQNALGLSSVSFVTTAKGRDTDPLEDFCRDRYPKLVGALSLYCADAGLAEELAQEALARVVRDWRRVQKMDSPEAWVHRIAVNLANSFFRRRAAEARARDRLASDAERVAPPTSADDLTVRQAVAALPRRQKTALVLRYYAQLSVRETAEAMGCPEGTVKTLTYKAISMLRRSPKTEGLREVSNER